LSIIDRYKQWQAEADKRADKAIKDAETKNARDKIRSRLAIETANRKREVALAVTKQKEAEAKKKQAEKKLKGNSNSFGWLDSLINFGSSSSPKRRKTTVKRHKRKTSRR
jgi:membrane protein involved in colicin uptake